MRKIFATVKKIGYSGNYATNLVLDHLVNEVGDKINGELQIDNAITIICMEPKVGTRYMIAFKEVGNNTLVDVCETRKLRKVRKCDIFRRYKNGYHFIGGKHQGKKESDLNEAQLNQYCLWLARSSYNEITIKNALTILEKIHA